MVAGLRIARAKDSERSRREGIELSKEDRNSFTSALELAKD